MKKGDRFTANTWCVDPARKVPTVLAYVCCAKCRSLNALDEKRYAISSQGLVTPNFRCGGKACPVYEPIELEGWDGRILFCVAINRFMGRNGHSAVWKGELIYLHAKNALQARVDFINSETDPNKPYNIVDVAPVVGYTMDRDTGRISV